MKQILLEHIYTLFQKSTGLTTDTRQIKEGNIFIALKGGNFNGNEFAEKALEAGATCVIIDEASYQIDDRCIVVEDGLKALQELARHHRRQFDIPVLAITGTNGKTTTKELVFSTLETHYKTHYTKGNFNNHIGVPLTLLKMPKDTEMAVIEMGANHIGEIKELCEIAEPTHGLITNVGKAHLEGFGSFEGVKQTKSELYRYLNKNEGVIFINENEPFLSDLAGGMNRIIRYASADRNEMVDYMAQLVESTPFVKVAFNERTIQSQLFGVYNFNNILTAITIGQYFKVPNDKIKRALESYTPTNNRSQLIQKDGNTYLMDAYNANPTSMTNALLNFKTYKATSKVVILGDMLELGEESESEHQAILDLAMTGEFDKIIIVGQEFEAVKNQAVLHFYNVEELKYWFDNQYFKNHHFLIKGSRGIRLEQLLR